MLILGNKKKMEEFNVKVVRMSLEEKDSSSIPNFIINAKKLGNKSRRE